MRDARPHVVDQAAQVTAVIPGRTVAIIIVRWRAGIERVGQRFMERRERLGRDAREAVAEVVEVVVDRLERDDDRDEPIGFFAAQEGREDAAALDVVRLVVDAGERLGAEAGIRDAAGAFAEGREPVRCFWDDEA